MTKPGTVTAYLVPLGGKSNNAVAKYYGYPDAPYTMAVDDELTPEIYPAIEENDTRTHFAVGSNGWAAGWARMFPSAGIESHSRPASAHRIRSYFQRDCRRKPK